MLLDALGRGAKANTEFLSDGAPSDAAGQGGLHGLSFELEEERMGAFVGR